MRSIVVWLIGILLLPGWMGHLYAQMPEPTPTVTLDMRQVPLLDILMELEKQTGLFFSYESSLLKELPEVSLSVRDESLSYCLKRLFSPLPIIYRVTGQYIILKRKPRQYTISGFVRDSASYESLLGASVLVKSSRGGTMSNNYGFYSLILPPGKVRLRASYVGFKAMEIEIDLQRDTMIDFPLRSLASLGEVVIRGTRPRYEILSSRAGVIDVPAERVKSMPALLGEADLVKTLQQLPGVAVGTEGMTGLYVRGGGADENLYLLDGNPVYHVNHLLGFFSAFNPDAIKNTRFYKGSFPAEYGGRLSSVVDVRMNDGNRQEYHGNISVGLLSARANLEGPIVKDRSSFNVSVRRTWLDLITGTALAIINKNSDTKESFGYHFFDINAKVNHSFSERSRAYLSFYMGQDAFRQGSKEKHEDSDDMFLWRWGNLIGSAGWNYVFGQKLFGNLMVGYSRFRSHIRQEAKGYEIEGNRAERQSIKRDSRYKSEMEDLSVRLSVDYSPSMNHRIRMGTDYLYHNFRPENSQQRSWVNDSLVNPVYELLYDYSLIKGHEFSLFVSDVMMPVMNGIECCEALKTDERTAHIPVILLTALAEERQQLEGYGAGADDYLPKPFSLAVLKAKIKNLLKRSEQLKLYFRDRFDLRTPEQTIADPDKEFVSKVTRVVLAHLQDPEFDVELFCSEMAMSRASLFRKLKSTTGCSASSFTRNIRIKRAAELLGQHAYSIGEVAAQVGFSDPNYFTRCFKEIYGITPSEFIQTSPSSQDSHSPLASSGK